MLPTPSDHQVVTSWLNGRKAAVHLLKRPDATLYILKQYKAKCFPTYLRELFATAHLAKKTKVTPRLLSSNIFQRTFCLGFIPGQRVLEWVLERFAPTKVNLEEFQSCHGLQTNPLIQQSFANLRASASEEAQKLRAAIAVSYKALHEVGWSHGSADPRNILYHESVIYIIDLDHARPAFGALDKERASLDRWFGISDLKLPQPTPSLA
jgi:hypothetical protein